MGGKCQCYTLLWSTSTCIIQRQKSHPFVCPFPHHQHNSVMPALIDACCPLAPASLFLQVFMSTKTAINCRRSGVEDWVEHGVFFLLILNFNLSKWRHLIFWWTFSKLIWQLYTYWAICNGGCDCTVMKHVLENFSNRVGYYCYMSWACDKAFYTCYRMEFKCLWRYSIPELHNYCHNLLPPCWSEVICYIC